MKPSLQAGFQALPQLYDPEFQQVSVLLADYAVVFRLHRRAQFILRHGAGAERREGHAPPVVPFPLAEYHAQGLIFPRGEREAVIAPRRISLSAKRDADRPPLGGGFGGQQRRNPNAPQRGESIRASVSVTFTEAAFGCEKELNVERSEQCPTCKGNGCAEGTTPEVCSVCHGTGSVQTRRQTPMGVFASTSPCSKCGGTGRIIHQPCPDCHGQGRVRKRRAIKVNIPAGIDHGQTISLRGQGHAGKNGGPNGDLLITIMVQPHEIFRREGTSVFCEAPITYAQAVLGGTLEIPTIDGKVKYDIPEGTQTGSVFRLRGKGIPALNGRGRGDQYVTVNIETPKNLNKEQKEALKKFSDLLGESNYEKRKSFFGKKR